MADLTEKIDDLICSFEGGGDITMDTVAMLIFGWAVVALLVLAISKYVHGRFFAKAIVNNETPVVKKVIPGSEVSTTAASSASERLSDSDGEKVKSDGGLVFSKMGAPRSSGKFVPPTPPLRKRLSTKKGSGPIPAGLRTHASITPPTVTGPDPVCVRWVNELFVWLYSNLIIVDELLSVWLQTLNEYAKKSVVEVSILFFFI